MMKLIDADSYEQSINKIILSYGDRVSSNRYKKITPYVILADCFTALKQMPTVNPENLRPQGRLISTGYDEMYCEFGNCTVCGAENPMHNKYCRECGARLDRSGFSNHQRRCKDE